MTTLGKFRSHPLVEGSLLYVFLGGLLVFCINAAVCDCLSCACLP